MRNATLEGRRGTGNPRQPQRPPQWPAILQLSQKAPRIDPGLIATILGLTPAESLVTVQLAEGRAVRDIAATTGRQDGSIHWLLRRIYTKHGLSRQADLVRLVRSIAAFA